MNQSDIKTILLNSERIKDEQKTKGYSLCYITPLDENFFRSAVKKACEIKSKAYSEDMLSFSQVVVGNMHLNLVFIKEPQVATNKHSQKDMFRELNPVITYQMRYGFDKLSQNPSIDTKLKIANTFFIDENNYESLVDTSSTKEPEGKI